MPQFYTKSQIDSLGSTIGTRIKDSVNVSSVTSAIQTSADYHLLSKEEKASIDALLLQENTTEPCDPPASNINDYLAAFNAAIEGIPAVPPEDNSAWVPTDMSDIYPFYGGSESSSSFHASYRINNGPLITYQVHDEYDALNSFLNSIVDNNGNFLVKSGETTSFLYEADDNTIKGFDRSGPNVLEEYPVKLELIAGGNGIGNDLIQELFYGDITLYSLGRGHEVIPKGSFLIFKPNLSSELKTINFFSDNSGKPVNYFTQKRGQGLIQEDIDYLTATHSNINPLDGTIETQACIEKTVLGLTINSGAKSNDSGDGTIFPDLELDYSLGTTLKGGYLSNSDLGAPNVSMFLLNNEAKTYDEIIPRTGRTLTYPEGYGLTSIYVTPPPNFYPTTGKYISGAGVIIQSYLELFLPPEDAAYQSHPLYLEGYRPPTRTENGYLFSVTKG